MDIAIHPQRGLFPGITRVEVGDGGEPDVTTFVAFTDAFDMDKLRILFLVVSQNAGEIVVTIVGIELNVWHTHPFVLGA